MRSSALLIIKPHRSPFTTKATQKVKNHVGSSIVDDADKERDRRIDAAIASRIIETEKKLAIESLRHFGELTDSVIESSKKKSDPRPFDEQILRRTDSGWVVLPSAGFITKSTYKLFELMRAPKHPKLYLELYALYKEANRNQDAKQVLEAAIGATQSSPDLSRNLAETFLTSGLVLECIDMFLSHIKVARKFASQGYKIDLRIFHLTTRLLFLAQRFEESMKVCEIGLVEYPNDDQLTLRVAILLATTTNQKELAVTAAKAQLDKAMELQPSTRLVAAQLLSMTGKDKEAVPLYHSIVRDAPDLSLEPYGRLSLYYESIGDKKSAEIWDSMGEKKMMEREAARRVPMSKPKS